jgi:TPR repeat protein
MSERRAEVFLRMAAAGCVLLLSSVAYAIYAPKPAAAPTPQAAPPAAKVEVTPTDETAFYQRLQYVTQRRNLIGLKVADDVVKAIARGSADTAVSTLSSQAAAGDRDANIALVRVQHWCNRVFSTKGADYQDQLAKLATVLPQEKLARAAGVFAAEKPYLDAARQSCGKASFDYQAIEARLRQAAETGDPASATELSQFARDPAKRTELLQQAADKNFPPAMYALATNRLVAVQRGQTTENVASIRLLLKQAGRALPKAKVDLANCMALGCDGHPADAPTATAFGVDAARDGEPIAFLSMLRMPWGGRMPRVQIMAWQYYGDRLNEVGCTGDTYVLTAATFSQAVAMLEKGQPPQMLEEAHAEAEKLWTENSARAKKEQGCGE